MPKEIKTTIAVDGEAAFKRAINEANTSLKNMGTQLTLAQAQFKKDGDAMKLMETRSKALKGEIDQQENIVKALEKAVEDSSKAYGENSEKTEKWQAELNRAKAKLVNLQNELTLNEQGLDRNGKAFDDSSQKAADYQATLQTIGKNVSFQTVTEGIKGITGTIEGAIKKVFNFAKAIRETFADAGEWADTLMTDATKYGMDVETLQRWQNAADLIDTPVETIINARDKMSKKMKSGWKDGELDMWQVLGVDLRDADTGKLRDKMDVMWELGETLLHISEMQERGSTNMDAEALSMEVFGKSWRDLLPLFKAGRAEWEKTVAEQDVVSEQRVKALGELDDANQALENSDYDLQGYIVRQVVDSIRQKINWAAASTSKATEVFYGPFAQDTESGTYGQEGYVPGKQAGTYSTFSKDTAAEMIGKIAQRNLPLDNCVFVMGAEDFWKLKVTPLDQGSGIMLIGNDNRLLGIPVVVNNAINRSTQKGAASGHNIGLGNFAFLPTMQHGNIRLSVDASSAVASSTDEVITTINADFSMTIL